MVNQKYLLMSISSFLNLIYLLLNMILVYNNCRRQYASKYQASTLFMNSNSLFSKLRYLILKPVSKKQSIGNIPDVMVIKCQPNPSSQSEFNLCTDFHSVCLLQDAMLGVLLKVAQDGLDSEYYRLPRHLESQSYPSYECK